MKTVKQLSEELEMNGDLTDLMDVLKGIAATEFWILQKKKKRFEEFILAFEGFFRFVDFIDVQHPFVQEQGKLAIIMITSDEGFMGGLNTRVITAQSGNVVTGDIGVMGSSFSGTREGDVITFTLIYKLSSGRSGGGRGRKSIGELRINSDGTRLTGTRSGGAFRKNSEWILTREVT